MEFRFLLSFDLDWAPEYALDDLYGYLKSSGVPATIFFTHRSPATEKLSELDHVEPGIHPNLIGSDQDDKRLDELLAVYPEAKGIRTHNLYFHSGLLKLYHQRRIEYLSHDIFFLQENIAPFYDWSGLVRMPIFWEDDVHATYFAGDFRKEGVKMNSPGLKIFNFHPTHIFLNTNRFEGYVKAKPDLGDERKAMAHQNKGIGVRTFFEEVLGRAPGYGATKLIEACREFKSKQKYEGKYSPDAR
jgi:hypothetical protein